MAEKTEKKPNIFVRAGKGSVKFIRDTKNEIKKIVWPTTKAVFRNMGVVLVMIVVLGAFSFGLDVAFTNLLKLVMDVAA